MLDHHLRSSGTTDRGSLRTPHAAVVVRADESPLSLLIGPDLGDQDAQARCRVRRMHSARTNRVYWRTGAHGVVGHGLPPLRSELTVSPVDREIENVDLGTGSVALGVGSVEGVVLSVALVRLHASQPSSKPKSKDFQCWFFLALAMSSHWQEGGWHSGLLAQSDARCSNACLTCGHSGSWVITSTSNLLSRGNRSPHHTLVAPPLQ